MNARAGHVVDIAAIYSVNLDDGDGDGWRGAELRCGIRMFRLRPSWGGVDQLTGFALVQPHNDWLFLQR